MDLLSPGLRDIARTGVLKNVVLEAIAVDVAVLYSGWHRHIRERAEAVANAGNAGTTKCTSSLNDYEHLRHFRPLPAALFEVLCGECV